MLKGRLGLETARIPHTDRHGMLWLGRGRLQAEDGTLHFVTAGTDELPAGDYGLPFQMLSCIVLMPGTAVSHDALRLLARHGTTLLITGEDGVRFYASLPAGPNESAVARQHARLWTDPEKRIEAARRMYAWRLGEVLPAADLNVLRGIEGARMKETYKLLAQQFGLAWSGRHYDRSDPIAADPMNQAINHAATALEAAAMTAVAAVGALPPLGFIHEDSSNAFPLDVADLYRHSVTLPVAFEAVRNLQRRNMPLDQLEREVRRLAGRTFREKKLIPTMIDRIKELLDDRHRDA